MTWSKTRIQKHAVELLLQASIKEPPIPVERIAVNLGARIRYEPFEGELSGLLFREQDRSIIGVNALHPKTRQRFTIAHEIGHMCLHQYDQLHVDRQYPGLRRDKRSAESIDPDEIAANAFAAELLMPAFMLERDLNGHVVDFENDEFVRRLASKYKVSLQAMIVRLTNLRVIAPMDSS